MRYYAARLLAIRMLLANTLLIVDVTLKKFGNFLMRLIFIDRVA